MELYTEEELGELLDEAYNLGQQDLIEYIDETYEEEESAFDQVMNEEDSNNPFEEARKRGKARMDPLLKDCYANRDKLKNIKMN